MIKTIVLEFDDKKISLTLDQALRLRDELNSLFSVQKEYIPYPVKDYYPPYTWISTYEQSSGNFSLCWQEQH